MMAIPIRPGLQPQALAESWRPWDNAIRVSSRELAMISAIAKIRCLCASQDGSRVMWHARKLALLIVAILTLGNYPGA